MSRCLLGNKMQWNSQESNSDISKEQCWAVTNNLQKAKPVKSAYICSRAVVKLPSVTHSKLQIANKD